MTTPDASSVDVRADPGSFRDWDGRVVISPRGVHRVLSPEGWADWEALRGSETFRRHLEAGTLVATEVAESPPFDAAAVLPNGVGGVLEHERVPVVSYPYEWPFSMLKDAALLQLQLTREGIDDGLMLKDATPYNVQWRGTAPVFVDVGSFGRLEPGQPWPGYRQFCMQYLNPLLLQAHLGLDHQRLLRGSLDGIAPTDAARLLRGRHRLRRGVMSNVVLHARLERRYAESDREQVAREVSGARFKPELIKANVARLEKVVRGLSWAPARSEWSEYRDTNTYEADDDARKQAFVAAAAARARARLAWDVGANDGVYSRIAAEHSQTVLALDIDHLIVERLYRDLRERGPANVTPLVFDLADPSPGLGWRNAERSTLEARARPDLVLALAVIHHVCIGRNVPVAEFLDWLVSLGAAAVVEFPEREDPMARRLLSRKGPGASPDYTLEHFESALRRRFEVVVEQRLPSGTRVLYEVRPRASSA